MRCVLLCILVVVVVVVAETPPQRRDVLVVFEESLHWHNATDAQRTMIDADDCSLADDDDAATAAASPCTYVVFFRDRIHSSTPPHIDIVHPFTVYCVWLRAAAGAALPPRCRADKPWIRNITLRCAANATLASQCSVVYDAEHATNELLFSVVVTLLLILCGVGGELWRWSRRSRHFTFDLIATIDDDDDDDDATTVSRNGPLTRLQRWFANEARVKKH